MSPALQKEHFRTQHRANLASVLVLSLLASLLLSDAAWACAYMSEQAQNAVAAAGMCWLASKVIGIAIVGIEVIRKRYVLSAAMAAFTVYFFPWISSGIGDCGMTTVQTSQTGLAVMVLLLTFELFGIRRSWLGRNLSSDGRTSYVATSLAGVAIIQAAAFFFFTPLSWAISSWGFFFPVTLLESVLGMAAFAGLVWGLGRPIYRVTRT